MSSTADPGFFGKLPGLGDFVSRRLSREFIDRWDGWLQQAIAVSRDQLGEAWLDNYLISPVWRYVLSRGVCNDMPWAGILMPSVDRVGRYFPLTIATAMPRECNPFQVARDVNPWFRNAENLALATLELDNTDIEVFSEQVSGLGPACQEYSAGSPPGRDIEECKSWHVHLSSVDDLGSAYSEIAANLMKSHYGTYSLWWSAGSEQVDPGLLVCPGLPPIDGFSALLSGDWSDYGWLSWATAGLAGSAQPDSTPDEDQLSTTGVESGEDSK